VHYVKKYFEWYNVLARIHRSQPRIRSVDGRDWSQAINKPK